MMTDPHRFLMLSAKKSEKIPNKSAKYRVAPKRHFADKRRLLEPNDAL